MKRITQKGMSLIELTVVLLILIALAGLVIPYVTGTSKKALCDATDISMSNIKRVIMERYYLDTLGNFPADRGATDYSLNYLHAQGAWNNFDPVTQIGWRGPYLSGGVALDAAAIADLDASFSAGGGGIHVDFAVGEFVIYDGWGRPIALQVLNGAARLVSAGFGTGVSPGGTAVIETVIGSLRPAGSDDRILYLNVATPASDVNPSCG